MDLKVFPFMFILVSSLCLLSPSPTRFPFGSAIPNSFLKITVGIQYHFISVSGIQQVVRHLCNLLNDLSDKSSIHLAPYTVITIVLTAFPMLCFPSPWLFCNYQSVLPTFFAFSTLPPTIVQPSVWSLCLWACFCFVCLFICSLDSTCKGNYVELVFVCLISLTYAF